MSTFKPSQLEAVKDMDDRIAVEVERLRGLPHDGNLSHAIIKLESARRGLQAAVEKNKP